MLLGFSERETKTIILSNFLGFLSKLCGKRTWGRENEIAKPIICERERERERERRGDQTQGRKRKRHHNNNKISPDPNQPKKTLAAHMIRIKQSHSREKIKNDEKIEKEREEMITRLHKVALDRHHRRQPWRYFPPSNFRTI